MTFEGVDVETAEFSADRLTIAAGIAGDVASAIDGLSSVLGYEWDLYTPAKRLATEIETETADTALILAQTAHAMRMADQGVPFNVIQAYLSERDQTLGRLRSSLDDHIGSHGTAAELDASYTNTVFGDDGPPSPPSGLAEPWVWHANNVTAVVLASLTGADAAAYWNTLTTDEKSELIEARPDLVARLVVTEPAADLTDDELTLLQDGLEYPVWTTEFFADASFSGNLGIVVIEVGGGVSLTITKNSTGRVEIEALGEFHAGVGREIGNASNKASVTGGGVYEITHTFNFDDERAAAAAVKALMEAYESDTASAVTTLHHNRHPIPVDIDVDWDKLKPWNLFGGGDEVRDTLADIFVTHGATSGDGFGVYGKVEGEFDVDAVFDADVEAQLEGRALVYDIDDVNLADGNDGRTGILVSGQFSANAEGDVGPLDEFFNLPDRASIDLKFSIDGYELDADPNSDADRRYVEFAFAGQYGVGQAGELPDDTIIEIDASFEAVNRFSTTYTVPLNDDTAQAIQEFTSNLVNGTAVDNNLFDRLAPYSEQTNIVQAGVAGNVEGETEIGPVSVGTNVGGSVVGTVSVTHRFPGGDEYDVMDASGIVLERFNQPDD